MNTIEAALSLSALVVVAGAIVAALATMGAYISAVDIAGAAARAHAIGLDYDPPAGRVTTQELSLIHISEPTRPCGTSRMPSSA